LVRTPLHELAGDHLGRAPASAPYDGACARRHRIRLHQGPAAVYLEDPPTAAHVRHLPALEACGGGVRACARGWERPPPAVRDRFHRSTFSFGCASGVWIYRAKHGIPAARVPRRWAPAPEVSEALDMHQAVPGGLPPPLERILPHHGNGRPFATQAARGDPRAGDPARRASTSHLAAIRRAHWTRRFPPTRNNCSVEVSNSLVFSM
jgi:hypothetical protein